MTPESLMKKRVNTAFLALCLTLAVQTVAAIPSQFFAILNQYGLGPDPYYTDFILIQFLYPVMNCVMVLIVLRCIRFPLRAVVTVRPLKGDFIPWLGVFLGVSVGMNYLVNLMLLLLEWAGFPVPDVFSSYDPQTLPQAVWYFIILAILPAISEEILCRAGVAGVLKYFHPWTAVLVSAFGFGLMHATLQQIPFAFALGVVLGFVYVKTGNLLYPILFHFVNNGWVCVVTFLSVWAGEDVAAVVGYCGDGAFVLFGMVSLIYLIVKKQFTLKEIPHSLDASAAGRAVVKSPWFWVFTGVYGATTVLTLFASVFTEFVGNIA